MAVVISSLRFSVGVSQAAAEHFQMRVQHEVHPNLLAKYLQAQRKLGPSSCFAEIVTKYISVNSM